LNYNHIIIAFNNNTTTRLSYFQTSITTSLSFIFVTDLRKILTMPLLPTPTVFTKDKPNTRGVGWYRYYEALSTLSSRDTNIDEIKKKIFPYRWASTALHMASYHDAVGVVHELLRLGSDVKTLNNYGETPLEAAISGNATRVVKYLTHYNSTTKSRHTEYRSTTKILFTPHALDRARERGIIIDSSLSLEKLEGFPIYSIDKGCIKYLDIDKNILYFMRGTCVVTMVRKSPLQTLECFMKCE
jgi:hypothetical protein